jgi:hypothetical protein
VLAVKFLVEAVPAIQSGFYHFCQLGRITLIQWSVPLIGQDSMQFRWRHKIHYTGKQFLELSVSSVILLVIARSFWWAVL